MSGHSKWHNIRIRKSKMDAVRGKLFTKVTREIIVAAREAGGNPETNLRLKKAIQKAKEVNMPRDNIEKAILRGTGELEGVNYEEYIYEGYGSAGVAIMCEVMTDNRSRTLAEIRHIFSKYGGSLGEAGCVNWLFKKKGLIIINRDEIEEEEIFALAIEGGAEDIQTTETSYEITTALEDLDKVKSFLQEKGVNITSSEISMIPQNTIRVEGKDAEQVLRLVGELEENDDVQHVYANFDIPEKIMEKMEV